MCYYSIDRFEDEFVVCEDDNGDMVEILRKIIPDGAREGDVLAVDNGGNYYVDECETQRRRDYIMRLLGRKREIAHEDE